MGADFSPTNEIAGAREALAERPDIQVVLFGKKDLLPAPTENLKVVDCTEVISMDDEPVSALKQKRDSSIVRGVLALKTGEIDAFVSAGNTGAVMSSSTLELGRIKGVSRPMIGAQFPRSDGGFTLVFDVGAT